MKHTLFITGAAGYVGAMLADQFIKRADVEKIIGLDKDPMADPVKDNPRFVFVRKNTFDDWEDEVKKYNPDIVIHAAWQIREMYGNRKKQWKWNVDGSDKVFNFSFSHPSVKRLIHYSTVASYGAYPDNEIARKFTENDPLRETDYLYAEEKRIIEEHLKEKYAAARKNGSGVTVSVIRPAAITGPRGRYARLRFGLQSALSGALKKSKSFWHKLVSAMVLFTPITKKWCRQFIHEDDITDITALLAFKEPIGEYEIYNAAPPGDIVLGNDMARALNRKPVMLPPFLIRAAFFIMWNLSLGAIPTSRGGWKSYSYPISVDGSKITKLAGFTYKYLSKDAFIKNEGRYATRL